MSDSPLIAIDWDTKGPIKANDPEFGSELQLWTGDRLILRGGVSHYAFIERGVAWLSCASGRFEVQSGMYVALPGGGELEGDGRGIVITRPDHRCLFNLGGPIEEQGRLRYVDGCTDTLLLAPAIVGAPCLNLLHLPAHTHQTLHTHPSVRVGLIVSGRGHCHSPSARVPLSPGKVFIIPAESEHAFHTEESPLRVIAYHPDTDTGPTHNDHPMINRTYVDGESASQLQQIQTRAQRHS